MSGATAATAPAPTALSKLRRLIGVPIGSFVESSPR
jgi:hypothetical protein